MKRKVAIVAGVGSGLGAAICRKLAEKGYTTFALSRSNSVLFDQEDETLGQGNIVAHDCDINNDQQFANVLESIHEEYGPVSVYVHNAHYLHIGSFLDTSITEFELAWKTSTRTAFVCKLFSPNAETIKWNSFNYRRNRFGSW